jgi:membrane protease YdiL (CAAX protease family)
VTLLIPAKTAKDSRIDMNWLFLVTKTRDFRIVPKKIVINKNQILRIGVWAVAITIVGIFICTHIERVLQQSLKSGSAFYFPTLKGFHRFFDLSIGLAIVAFTEEVVWRSLSVHVLSPKIKLVHLLREQYKLRIVNPQRPNYLKWVAWYFVPVSCLLFGLIHWSNGIHAVVTAALWGLLPMIALIETGSLIPGLICHYFTNLVIYSGVFQ